MLQSWPEVLKFGQWGHRIWSRRKQRLRPLLARCVKGEVSTELPPSLFSPRSLIPSLQVDPKPCSPSPVASEHHLKITAPDNLWTCSWIHLNKNEVENTKQVLLMRWTRVGKESDALRVPAICSLFCLDVLNTETGPMLNILFSCCHNHSHTLCRNLCFNVDGIWVMYSSGHHVNTNTHASFLMARNCSFKELYWIINCSFKELYWWKELGRNYCNLILGWHKNT